MSTAPHISESDPLALTKAELARALGISERHLHTLDSTGRLGPRAIRLNRSVRYVRSEVEAWLAAGAPPTE
ncbi:helix-turn-helix transcriptional regulator [Aeoliella mucimassa]|uniref:Helix-turn-helix domain protein n=1 Tax=Aeoliella mucimassa TaxID=2527972 RepID=A0A518AUZ9_9BACT|nr:helix-turn-helix domain-containing protein [Aeoliella mucimassa]QDU58546.1 Helix-turn-helix domain protein [Aeoliella mucimassa]